MSPEDRLSRFHPGRPPRTLAALLAALICAALLAFFIAMPASAGTFGIIEGTVIDGTTLAPLANVRVVAVASSGQYKSTTNAQGFFSLAGVTPDTLTVTLELPGYETITINGVTVQADEQTRLDEKLGKSLKTVAQVTTRSAGGAFQPGTTADSYTVTGKQIASILGNDLQTSQSKLLAALPGVSATSSGLPVIRGGKGNSINYEVEGIPFSDAWSNQAVATRLSTASVSELQLTPGVGSASYGNSGTGTVNVLAKRGTHGQGASAEFGLGAPGYFHSTSLTYGFATPDNRLSNFLSFTGSNAAPLYGGYGAPPAGVIGRQNAVSMTVDRHVTDNLVYRFGNNKSQALQLYADLQQNPSGYGYGGWQAQCYNTCDQVGIVNYGLQSAGLSEQQLCTLVYLYPGQTGCNQNINRPLSVQNSHEAFKLGYTNALDSLTFLNVSYYQDHALTTFDYIPDSYIPIGGWNRGVTLDLTRQLSAKNLIQLGGIYNAEAPFLGTINPYQATYYTYYSPNTEIYDFVPPSQCPAAGVGNGGTPDCGWLQQYFPGGLPKIPGQHSSANLGREDVDVYVNETWIPNSRLKADVGLRDEMANLHHPALYDLTTCTFTYIPLTWDTSNFDTTKTIGGANCPKATFPDLNPVFHPDFLEPRIALSYRAGDTDAFRATFGRSMRLPRDNSMENSFNFNQQAYVNAGFGNIPSHWFDYGGTYNSPWYTAAHPNGPYAHAAQCGAYAYDHGSVKYEVPCLNYAQELAWDNNYAGGNPGVLSALVPETFTNYDFSYEHQFTRGALHNVGFKVTPWYRRGYNAESSYYAVETDAQGKSILNPDGTPKTSTVQLDSSIGQDYADGIELLITKDNPTGISGLISATYTNSFSTAGDVYGGSETPVGFQLNSPFSRINYISPFYASLGLSYETRSGWRLNPYLHFNVGYPRGAGIYTPITFAGKASYVPNTNVTGDHIAYVDPANPGSAFAPNIVATTGTDQGAYQGGVLTHPFTSADLTIEHKDKHGNVLGLTVQDLFNGTLFEGPQANASAFPNQTSLPFWQPIATGISGPYSGVDGRSYIFPNQYVNTPYKYGGNQPYYNFPQNQGRTYYLYFKMAKI